jgi:hypothetical protein
VSRHKRPNRVQNYPIFESVIKAYIHNRFCLNLAPLQAMQFHPEAGAHRRNVHHSIEFCADVEKATKVALLGNPLWEDCIDQLLKELCGDSVDDTFSLGLRAEVVSKCARIYRARGLEPANYFRKLKR